MSDIGFQDALLFDACGIAAALVNGQLPLWTAIELSGVTTLVAFVAIKIFDSLGIHPKGEPLIISFTAVVLTHLIFIGVGVPLHFRQTVIQTISQLGWAVFGVFVLNIFSQ